jgi:hypothetical protein
MTPFDPQARSGFSTCVRPIVSNDVKCVLIEKPVERMELAAFEFLLGFAREDALRVRRGREELRREGDAGLSATREAPGDA